MTHGDAAEELARAVAARLGVPDFVYHPAKVAKGQASREISDGLLVAGTKGVILQVKSREPVAGASDRPDKIRGWLAHNEDKAFKQAEGSRRRLKAGSRFRSLRGYERQLAGDADWPAVILLDHPQEIRAALPVRPNTLQMTLRDWEAVHHRLRSTAAVIDYVERAISLSPDTQFGREQQRYEYLAGIDTEAASRAKALPLIPADPVVGRDLHAVDQFDKLIDRVADSTNLQWTEDNYLGVVEILDRQPVLWRALIGNKLIDGVTKHTQSSETAGFLVRATRGDRVAFLLDTAIDDQGDEDIGHGIDIAGYGYLRHRQAIEAGEGKESSTLAIGMRFDPTKGVRYGFALFQGTQPRMPDLDYRALELLHGRLDPARNRVVPIKMRRNDRCLCGSGKKTKQCCGLEPGLGSPAPPTP